MKNTAYLLGIFILFLFIESCTEDPETQTDQLIINNSDQKVAFTFYKSGTVQESFSIGATDFKKYTYSRRGHNVIPPPFNSDSVVLIYNDTTRIVHYRDDYSTVARNVLNKAFWSGG